ncbi:MAG: SusC/RagA family TonB-linked outer membrane protein [Sphingobacteriaceae bacterium]|nr:MAG: SusC/RagA family TonB-linked outer membrane protein [Sphingobacteriaceae bacterium]
MKQKLLIFFLFGLFALQSAFAQTRKITGTVTGSDDGKPIPGVSIIVQNTKVGTLTDGDGRFNLSLPSGTGTLSFTFIGYATQNLTITGLNNYSVKLVPTTRQLTEVVVTDGYAVQSKKSYTGSATTVAGAENENKPFSTPLQALQGEVAGLNISLNSGQPGANVQVRLRGQGSIGLSSNPLYVIDGMIINSGDLSRLTTTSNVLAGINENDIESVTVLKDATATAIYGSRASNGVIVINTKRGKAGKTSVRFDAEAGTTDNLPFQKAGRPLTADEYKELFIEGENNAAIDFPATFTPARVANDIANYVGGTQSNNWYNLLTRKGTQQQYNVSINGGSENSRVYASAGYFEQQATIIKSDLKRYTGQLNLDQKISNKIALSSNINFSNIDQNTPSNGGAFANPVGNVYFLRPFQLGYNADGSLNSNRTGLTNFPSGFNNLYLAEFDKKSLSQTRILSNVQLKWNIWDELKFTSYASADYNLLEEIRFDNPIMGDGRTAGGRGYDYYTRYFNWLTRNQLSYRYNVKGIEDFYIDASLGYEAQRSQGYFITANTNLFPNQPALTVSAVGATPIAGSGTFSNYTFDGLFSTGTINFQNKYSLSGSFRRDGSSVFGATQRFGNFYSVGGAWNIDQENFFKIQKVLSTAKIRASVGTVGNAQGLGNYQARPTAGYGVNYAGATGQNFNTLGNVDLTWESQKKYDLGVDLGFFNDGLSFAVDLYKNQIDRLILNAPISRTTGFSTVTQNIGAMRNQGVEFTIKGYPFRNKDFTWTTNFNIASNSNKVLKLVGGTPVINGVFRYQEGKDFNTYYARQYAGVNPLNGDALWYTDATRTATTNVYANALRVDKYQSDPKLFGGFNNNFNYKSIILTADFYYNFGNMVNDGAWGYYLKDGSAFDNNKYYYIYQNRWTPTNTDTDVPKYSNAGVNAAASSSFSSRDLYYGDYIRLKNLTIGYDFKTINFLKKYGISKLYLYGRGTNIWTKTFDKRLPFDPELGPTGQNNLDVYQVRTFTIGLNVGL